MPINNIKQCIIRLRILIIFDHNLYSDSIIKILSSKKSMEDNFENQINFLLI